MKKLAFSFIVLMICSGGYVLAGTNGNATVPGNNGKDQDINTTDKSNDKYNFTLFSFFNAAVSLVKSDSVLTDKKEIDKKPVLKTN